MHLLSFALLPLALGHFGRHRRLARRPQVLGKATWALIRSHHGTLGFPCSTAKFICYRKSPTKKHHQHPTSVPHACTRMGNGIPTFDEARPWGDPWFCLMDSRNLPWLQSWGWCRDRLKVWLPGDQATSLLTRPHPAADGRCNLYMAVNDVKVVFTVPASNVRYIQ